MSAFLNLHVEEQTHMCVLAVRSCLPVHGPWGVLNQRETYRARGRSPAPPHSPFGQGCWPLARAHTGPLPAPGPLWFQMRFLIHTFIFLTGDSVHIKGSILHNLPRELDMTEQEPLVFALIMLFMEVESSFWKWDSPFLLQLSTFHHKQINPILLFLYDNKSK